MSILKIFSHQKYLSPEKTHTTMLYPFWGKNREETRDPTSGRFDRYTATGSDFFQMVPLEEADVAVLPANWEQILANKEAGNRALELGDAARQNKKPLVVFFNSDSFDPIPIKGASIFRTSFYRSTRKPNEFAMPAWSEDFVERYLGSQVSLRPKREKPTVGFCGYAPLTDAFPKNIVKGAWRLGHNLSSHARAKPNPSAVRTRVMRTLSKSPLLETNFIVRKGFLGQALLSNGETDFDVLQKTRREYVKNMVDSDYVICARGAGNFSYRLYETLSCGRIPLFIDTDCVLPYDRLIDWKQYSIWVDEKDADEVVERVMAFNEAISPEAFTDLQIRCRKLWEDWLSPQGFFKNFYRHFLI